jgi:hypothetical protein
MSGYIIDGIGVFPSSGNPVPPPIAYSRDEFVHKQDPELVQSIWEETVKETHTPWASLVGPYV